MLQIMRQRRVLRERIDAAPSSGPASPACRESLIACQPRIDEPSKPKPSSKIVLARARGRGAAMCCQSAGEVHELEVDHHGVVLLGEFEYLLRALIGPF